jgi:hypothetical protein
MITAVTTYFKVKIFALCLQVVSLPFVIFPEYTAIISINRTGIIVLVINTCAYVGIVLLCPTPPTHGTVNQPQYLEMLSASVLSSKKVSKYPGFHPTERELSSPNSKTRAPDHVTSRSLSAGKTLPYVMCW